MAANKDECGYRFEGARRAGKVLLFVVVLALILSLLLALAACDNDDSSNVSNVWEDDGGETEQDTDPPTTTPVEPSIPETKPDIDPTLPDLDERFEGITFEDGTFTYDGEEHMIYAKGYPEGAVLEYSAEGFVDAGAHPVSVKISKEGYRSLTLTATLYILQKKLDLRLESATFDYDGVPHSIYVQGALPSDAVVTYFNNGQTEIGDYEVVASVALNDNYEPVEDMRATLSIRAKTCAIRFVHWDDTVEVRNVTSGESLTDIPANLFRAYYEVEWDETSFENVYDDMTVTEVCTPIVYRVDYVLNGGINSTNNATLESQGRYYLYTVESEPLTLSPASYLGHEFLGWFEDDVRIYVIPDSNGPRNMTLTARFDGIPDASEDNGENLTSSATSASAIHRDGIASAPKVDLSAFAAPNRAKSTKYRAANAIDASFSKSTLKSGCKSRGFIL